MNIVFYGNGSAGNHGCEAIIRGTVAQLAEKNEYIIQSDCLQEDVKYGLDSLARIFPATKELKKGFRFLMAYIKLKLTGKYTNMDGLRYLENIAYLKGKAEIAFSVGGDNYCYGGTQLYAYLNRAYKKNGLKTVLWGCSIEPDVAKMPMVEKDLAAYDLIVARESITYEAVKNVGKKVFLAPDPAFYMKSTECKIDERLKTGNVIGINISPMIISSEKSAGIAYKNYFQLIKYILENTDSYIALIPHVVWERNDDRKVLKKLYEDFNCDSRLILVEDHTAPELKYIISKSKMFVGARTHATIAAYSSCVPTLVVGYSVKARGIAKDLFGTEEHYVIPVQHLSSEEQLTEAFSWIYEREDLIRAHLSEFIPKYMERGNLVKGIVENL